MSSALVARGKALGEAGAERSETWVYVAMLEGPDVRRGGLGGFTCVLGELVPSLAEAGVFEEGRHCDFEGVNKYVYFIEVGWKVVRSPQRGWGDVLCGPNCKVLFIRSKVVNCSEGSGG